MNWRTLWMGVEDVVLTGTGVAVIWVEALSAHRTAWHSERAWRSPCLQWPTTYGHFSRHRLAVGNPRRRRRRRQGSLSSPGRRRRQMVSDERNEKVMRGQCGEKDEPPTRLPIGQARALVYLFILKVLFVGERSSAPIVLPTAEPTATSPLRQGWQKHPRGPRPQQQAPTTVGGARSLARVQS